MKVLVTGASGFIGRHVVDRLLSEGIEVVGASRRKPDMRFGIAWREVDLLQPGAAAALVEFVRPTHLIHLAWNASPGLFWIAPDNVQWADVTQRLVEAFFARGGQGAVCAGSCAEYGWGQAQLSEGDAPAPATLYGRMKDEARAAVLAAAERGGAPCAWGRVFWLYGPHEPRGRLVSDVSAALANAEPADCSDGLQARDFLHVADVAGALVAALRVGWSGVFNIGSGKAVPVRDVVCRLAEVAGRPDLLRLGARASAPNDPPVLAADVLRLADGIGFRPRFSLAQGLENTMAWWLATRPSQAVTR